MARVSEAEIQRLKREVSVERLAEARGVKLRQHGKDLMGLCPFHDDHEPSLVITPDKNLWHCLGACQAGGSAIDWVMRAEGVAFRHAVELLREGLPSLAAQPQAPGLPPKRSTVLKATPLAERSASDEALMERVVTHYQEALGQSEEALVYLEKRGIRNAEAIERFRLGYANRTLGYRLPAKTRKEGEELRARLVELGIYRQSGHEHLNGSLVFPIFDEAGRLVEVYGRKLRDDLRVETPVHMYLPGPHLGVWNWDALAESKEIILCESLIDALTFWCAGFRNVTGCYGVEGFTGDHRRAFAKHGTERVYLAFDRDEAGERAAEKLSSELMENGIETFRVLFPRGMDANEYALKLTPANKSLGLALRQAEWLGKGKTAPVPESVEPVEVIEPLPSLAAEPLLVPAQAAPESMPAEPEPVAPPPAEPSDEVVLVFGDRRWRVRGLWKNSKAGELRVNLLVSRESAGFHVDTLELYSARQRAVFVKLASEELGLEEQVIKRELGRVLLRLEELVDERERAAKGQVEAAPAMSDEERREALELLRDPKLVERILSDFEQTGVVGEETNKLVGYLGATSRKLDEPLAVILQSSSAAGKSSLMEALLGLMPEEERVLYSAMTGQSLFYMGEQELRHKILAIVEEEGATRASYALKLLQSEGRLTIASTGKDPATGRLVTHEYRVEGPVMILLTTTAIELDEELLNRCIVLTVDEGREQTRAIHVRQRAAQTLAGFLGKRERERVRKLHQNAQRLLRPLPIVNPHADRLTFLDHQTRTRRDHTKYLALIRAIALLHQHQRAVRTVEHRGEKLEYIEATLDDIRLANRLSHEVLGRSLDELPPQTRRLVGLLDQMVSEETSRLGISRKEFRFSRREVRDKTGWGNTQLKIHLGRLEELEYLVAHRAQRGQAYAYELSYDGGGRESGPFLSGLLDVDEIGVEYDGDRSGSDAGWSGSEAERSGLGRGLVGPESAGGRDADSELVAHESRVISEGVTEITENAFAEPAEAGSYRRRRAARLVAVGR
ncbi:MAG: toprim domain-containing protein [Sorangiineae bacterium PRO1]|nr:toprim domain-containing protein [Sorangiineae bacterium PRO1]